MLETQTLKSNRLATGRIKCEIAYAGQVDELVFYDIRGAFVWEPVPYFLILGEEAIDELYFDQSARGVLRILGEYENSTLSLNDFLNRLTDSLSLHSATIIYSDLRKKEYSDLFYEYQDKLKLNHLSLIGAPFCENFRLGMSITQDWIDQGLVRIPKTSLVWNQLETLHPGDIENDPEKRFPFIRRTAEKHPVPLFGPVVERPDRVGGGDAEDPLIGQSEEIETLAVFIGHPLPVGGRGD